MSINYGVSEDMKSMQKEIERLKKKNNKLYLRSLNQSRSYNELREKYEAAREGMERMESHHSAL